MRISALIQCGWLLPISASLLSARPATAQAAPTKPVSSKTIVFIHGAFVTAHTWDNWVAHYQARGYTCLALAWPGKTTPAADLRSQHPDPAVAALTFDALVAHYEAQIRQLEEPPILVGHSIGGLVVQLLLQRGVGAAGVAIHSAPPRGLLSLRPAFMRASTKLLAPLAPADKPYLMSQRDWARFFTNGMTPAEQQRTYEAYLVPESRRIIRGPLTKVGRVDYRQPHAPLLFVAGTDDRIFPPSLNKKNQRKYRHQESVVAYKAFAGRNHFVLGQDNWQEVATYVEAWLTAPTKE